MTELTSFNATHLLSCNKGLGRAYYSYRMRCHIIKEMPDKKRYKILVFGFQNSRGFDHDSRIRYVNKDRVSVLKPPVYKPVKGELDNDVVFKNSDVSGHPKILGA